MITIGVFGPTKKEVWQAFANEIGATYVEGGLFKPDKVVARTSCWTITLDTYSTGDGDKSTTYTRVRAPLVTKDGFTFKIYREGEFSGVGKMLGTQDIDIGDEKFDREFVIRSNNDLKVKELLEPDNIKKLIEIQPHIRFEMREFDCKMQNSPPENVATLYFATVGVMKDTRLLKALFELFSETLNQLCSIDCAQKCSPYAIV